MRKRIVSTVLAVMAAVGVSLGAAAPAFADDHFDVTVRNTASGKCLAPQGESFADGVSIVQVTCNGSAFCGIRAAPILEASAELSLPRS